MTHREPWSLRGRADVEATVSPTPCGNPPGFVSSSSQPGRLGCAQDSLEGHDGPAAPAPRGGRACEEGITARN